MLANHLYHIVHKHVGGCNRIAMRKLYFSFSLNVVRIKFSIHIDYTFHLAHFFFICVHSNTTHCWFSRNEPNYQWDSKLLRCNVIHVHSENRMNFDWCVLQHELNGMKDNSFFFFIHLIRFIYWIICFFLAFSALWASFQLRWFFWVVGPLLRQAINFFFSVSRVSNKPLHWP